MSLLSRDNYRKDAILFLETPAEVSLLVSPVRSLALEILQYRSIAIATYLTSDLANTKKLILHR